MNHLRTISLAIVFWLLHGVPAYGQRLIPDGLTCAACSIILHHRTSIESDHPQAPLTGPPVQVVQDRHGNRIVVVPGALPSVFGPDGHFLRVIGRRGEGPGEYRNARYVTPLPGDSLLVVDTQLQRATVLAPGYSKAARTISFPLRPIVAVVLDWPRRVIVNGVSFTPELAGWPLHAFDLTDGIAEHLAVVQDTRGELRPDGSAALLRHLFEGDSTGFWSSHIVQYEVAYHSAPGDKQRTFERRPEWFSEPSRWSIGSPTIAPPPMVRSATVIRDTLWVALGVPRPDWQEAWQGIQPPPSGELARSLVPERTDLYRARIEAIDLRSGRLITAAYVDGLVVHMASDRTAFLYRLNDIGEPQLTVHDVALQPPSR